MYLCLSIDNMYQGRALPISPTQSNTMIDNNGCHPQRLLSVYLYILCDGSIRQGVLNLFYMKKVEVTLRPDLVESEKKDAYRIMGYVYMNYKAVHTVGMFEASELAEAGFLESYRYVTIMY